MRFIVPFAAGGAADVVTRIIATELTKSLGQTFFVENRTGANGSIGTEAVARAEPDGYTILVGSPGTLAINPHVFAQLPYNAETDFVHASHVANFPQVLAVNPKLGVTKLEDFITLVKGKPGAMNYGSSGQGSTGHLVTAMFLSQAGLNVVHVPFRGGAPAAQALIAGQVDFVIDGLPTFQGFVDSNSVKVLGISSAQRWPKLPDVPAIGEKAVPGFDLSSWVIFAAPKGTPPAVVAKLSAEVAKALKAEEVQKSLFTNGAIPVGSTPEGARAFQQAELAKWKRVVEVSGTKAP